MSGILIFRVVLILAFATSAWRLGDWRNWIKYYPTVLFTMVVNLSVSLLTYHHILWNFNPDLVVKTHTVVEFLNTYIVLSAATFVYLSHFPQYGKLYQYGYVILWILLFGVIEYTDGAIGGISYQHGWSFASSFALDCAMFVILRIHYLKPAWAWMITFLLAAIILAVFDFGSAEMK
ncbi:hypothetical protein SCACP_34220 [Sporomusa carbonis]|uniref:CBO0543 family protein n=1 Tax=Sporomusa carbonis TaxID=3076075 RepID=UPI003A732070